MGGNAVGGETAEILANIKGDVIVITIEERFALDIPATPRMVLLREMEDIRSNPDASGKMLSCNEGRRSY